MFKLKTLVLDIANFANNLITPIKINTTGASSGDVISFDGTNAVWNTPSGGGGSLIPLTTTIADCENTTSEIDIVTVTIPANTLAVGDQIFLEGFFTRSQNSGGTINLTAKLKNATNQFLSYGVVAQASNSGTFLVRLRQVVIVKSISGDTVTLISGTNTSSNVQIAEVSSFAAGATTAVTGHFVNKTYTNNTFDNTVGTTLEISITWGTANANAYIRVEEAQAYIIKKAV
jgi:hypothetical protein